MRSFLTRSKRERVPLAAATAAVALFLMAATARADVVPDPIPECVGHADGTTCTLSDGTAGACKTHQDDRRPGRSWQSCEKDTHECDHLEAGAPCHGYLHRPAHCKEFKNPDKGQTWRACQVDELSSDAQGAASSGSAPPAQRKGLGCAACSAAHGGPADSAAAGLSLGLLLLALVVLSTRRIGRRL
jgi:hypothetical protein